MLMITSKQTTVHADGDLAWTRRDLNPQLRADKPGDVANYSTGPGKIKRLHRLGEGILLSARSVDRKNYHLDNYSSSGPRTSVKWTIIPQ